jgi:hypothetical protein
LGAGAFSRRGDGDQLAVVRPDPVPVFGRDGPLGGVRLQLFRRFPPKIDRHSMPAFFASGRPRVLGTAPRARCVLRGMEIHTDGSNPPRSATNLVSETTKELDLRRAGFARDFRPLSAVRFRDRRQRRFWAICGPSAPENLEWLFQWCGSLPADSDCVVDGSRARSVIPLPSA